MKKTSTFEKNLLLFIKKHAIESNDFNSLEKSTLEEKIKYFDEIISKGKSGTEFYKEAEPLRRFVLLLSSDLPTNLKEVMFNAMNESWDKKTPVASILISGKREFKILSSGTNKSIIDTKRIDWWRDDSDKKKKDNYCVCAEISCILKYLQNNSSEKLIEEKPIIVVSLRPCHTCTRLIANIGIKHIVYIDEYNPQPKNTCISTEIIKEHKINIFNSWNNFLSNSNF